MTRLYPILRFLSRWLFWPDIVLITWGELTPNPPDLGPILHWDKLQHFTAYAGLALMASLALGLKSRLSPAVLDIILFGGALEMLQGFTGRDPDIFDFLANSFGALAGLTVGVFLLMLVDAERPD